MMTREDYDEMFQPLTEDEINHKMKERADHKRREEM